MLTNKRKAQLTIVGTFLLGLAVGTGGSYLVWKRSPSPPPNSPQALLDDLSQTLQLTPPQRAEVEGILKESRRAYQELRNLNRPQFLALRDQMRQQIRERLTPEQQAAYERWNKEQDARRELQRQMENGTANSTTSGAEKR
jgi:Spy/CpxP family protein refolding chaperone